MHVGYAFQPPTAWLTAKSRVTRPEKVSMVAAEANTDVLSQPLIADDVTQLIGRVSGRPILRWIWTDVIT